MDVATYLAMTTSLSPATWTAYVTSDVFEGRPHPEDGSPRDELHFYVVCGNDEGVRYASRVGYSTEDYSRDEAEARAEAFCTKVTAALAKGADPTQSSKWARTRSCYGSAAWSEDEELECEARDLEVEAGVAEADRFRRVVGIGA
jgi:hypothetical protein